jgi:hypothetical protein
MSIDPSGESAWSERWDQLFGVLSAKTRRMILISLAEAPQERRLRLPDAAELPNRSMETEKLTTLLQHHHLPALADAGYVCWESEPFVVQRGPNFEEAEFIVNKVLDSVDEIPQSLIDDCTFLQERSDNGAD